MISLEDFYAALENNKDGYTLIKNFLSEQDHATCLDIAKKLKPSEDEHYDSILFDPVKLLGEDHFFSKIDVEQLGKIYGLDSVDNVVWLIARDDPEFRNELHNDVHCDKNTVTIQWYLDMDDPKRKLYISHKDRIDDTEWDNNEDVQLLDTSANSMVAFLAKPNTYHGFKRGNGYRYNVRLRFSEKLVKDTFIHNYNADQKVCWYIDAKDMEVEYYPTDHKNFEESEEGTLEEFLARFTYTTLVSQGQHNILVSDNIHQYPQTLQFLKEQGFEKCVIVFAGGCITKKTIDFVYDNTNDYPVYGKKFDENNCMLRQFTVLNLNQIDVSVANGFKDYLSAYLPICKQFYPNKICDFYYAHPEEATYRALFDMARYPVDILYDIDDEYPELDEIEDEFRPVIKKSALYYENVILPSLPMVSVTTLQYK